MAKVSSSGKTFIRRMYSDIEAKTEKLKTAQSHDFEKVRAKRGAKDEGGGARSKATKTATGARSETTKRCEYCAFSDRYFISSSLRSSFCLPLSLSRRWSLSRHSRFLVANTVLMSRTPVAFSSLSQFNTECTFKPALNVDKKWLKNRDPNLLYAAPSRVEKTKSGNKNKSKKVNGFTVAAQKKARKPAPAAGMEDRLGAKRREDDEEVGAGKEQKIKANFEKLLM